MGDIELLKQQMCDIGRRMDARQFVAGNGGNITCRLGPDAVLCTPTLTSKGSMRSQDIATINLSGEQTAGDKPRSSEALLHLAIMKARPDVRAVVHCHPPHATAFAVTRQPIPRGVLPEAELFLGPVPLAPYVTPGDHRLAEAVVPLVQGTNVVLLSNHGTVSFDNSLEKAYWWTEILDDYCRVLILARQLGGIKHLSPEQQQELVEAKQRFNS